MEDMFIEWGGVCFAIGFMAAIPVCMLLDWFSFKKGQRRGSK